MVAKVVLGLGIVIFVTGASHFVYNAHERSNCFAEVYDPLTQHDSYHVSNRDCDQEVIFRDRMMRFDAGIAALGIALVIGSGVRLSNLRRRTRRWLLIGEVAVVGVVVVYVVVVAYAFR